MYFSIKNKELLISKINILIINFYSSNEKNIRKRYELFLLFSYKKTVK